MSCSRFGFCVVLFSLFVLDGFSGPVLIAADKDKEAKEKQADNKAEKKTDKAKKTKRKDKDSDPFAVPDGTAEELMEYISSLRKVQPKGTSREARMGHLTKMLNAASQACDKLLVASKESDDGLRHAAIAVQVNQQALRGLYQQLGDNDAFVRLQAFAEKVSKDDRVEIATLGKQLVEELKLELPPDADEDAAKRVATALKEAIVDAGADRNLLRVVMQTTMAMEQMQHYVVAADMNSSLADYLADLDDPKMAPLAEQFRGTARRLKLPGNPIEIDGKLLDGTDFDWDSYKGKVVLVDFWATWCGPCIRELPNVIANYERYHDRGFDVIGISLDEDREALEGFVKERKIAWPTLFSDEGRPATVKRYGISGVPTVILVDQKGKVVSLNARGPELGRLLAELLGPANEKDSDKKSSDEKSSDEKSSDEKGKKGGKDGDEKDGKKQQKKDAKT